jgi:hypothetical protein
MLNIEPIKLLKGSHADTGETGQGCVMNVIAYLNGEPQITDQSPCVCFVARPILIWLNDFLSDEDRQRMIPFIERAMGSRSDDPKIFVSRAEAAARFAQKCSEIAASAASAACAESAAWAADAASAARAADAADAASAASAACAESAASAASAAWAESAAWAADAASAADAARELSALSFEFLDEVLPKPPSYQPAVVIQRAEKLIEISA